MTLFPFGEKLIMVIKSISTQRGRMTNYKPKEWGLTEDEKQFFTDNFQLKRSYSDIFFIYHTGDWYLDKYPIFRIYFWDDYGFDVLENVIKEEGHEYVMHLSGKIHNTKWYGFMRGNEYKEYTFYGNDFDIDGFLEDYFKWIDEMLEDYRRG